MEKIVIVLGTDAVGSLWQGHFGDADRFERYRLAADGSIEPLGGLDNAAKRAREDHGAAAKMGHVLGGMGGVDCVLATRPSPNLRKMAQDTAVQPCLVEAQSVEALLRIVRDHAGAIRAWVQDRKAGRRTPEIPRLG